MSNPRISFDASSPDGGGGGGVAPSAASSRLGTAIFNVAGDALAAHLPLLQRRCRAALSAERGRKESAAEPPDAPLPPVVDLCLLSRGAKGGDEKPPKGFDALPAVILRGSGSRFALAVRRAGSPAAAPSASVLGVPSASSSSSSYPAAAAASDPVTDVRVVRREGVPLGYTVLTHTAGGREVHGSVVVCFARGGLAPVTGLAVVFPARGERPPADALRCGRNANEGVGAQAADEAVLYAARDPAAALEAAGAPAGVVALAHAVLTGEPGLATPAALALRYAVEGGLLDGAAAAAGGAPVPFVGALAAALSEALAASGESHYQTSVASLLQALLLRHQPALGVAGVCATAVAAMRCAARPLRQRFLEFAVDTCVRGFGRPAESDAAEEEALDGGPGGWLGGTVRRLADHAAAARELEAASKAALGAPLLGPRLAEVAGASAAAACGGASARQLAALVVVLARGVALDEGALQARKGPMGVAVKHDVMGACLHLMDRMHQAGGGSVLRMHRRSAVRAARDRESQILSVVRRVSEPNAARAAAAEGAGGRTGSPRGSPSRASAAAAEADAASMRGGHAMGRRLASVVRAFLCPALLLAVRPCTPPGERAPVPVSGESYGALLEFVTLAHHRHPALFKNEVGAMLEYGVLETAMNDLTPVPRRLAAIRAVTEIVRGVSTVADLYYNYDNLVNWPLFQRIMDMLTHVTEFAATEEDKAAGAAGAEAAAAAAVVGSGPTARPDDPPGRARQATVEFDTDINEVAGPDAGCSGAAEEEEGESAARGGPLDEAAAAAAGGAEASSSSATMTSAASASASPAPARPCNGPDAAAAAPKRDVGAATRSPMAQLQRACVEVLVEALRACDEWHARRWTPGSGRRRGASSEEDDDTGDRSPRPASLAALDRRDESNRERRQQQKKKQKQKASSSGNSLSVPHSADISQELIDTEMGSRPANERKATVLFRHSKHADARRANSKALRRAREKSLAKAIEYLEGLGRLRRRAGDVVTWIQMHQSRISAETLGEYLGGSRPKDEAPFELEVRLEYVRRLGFAGMDAEKGLRRFLVDSGFRLPGEAQKIDRLLDAFSVVFAEDNPGSFDDAEACYVTATAVLMLNTSLHNPNLRDKDRLTEATFVGMCLAIEGTQYTEQDFADIFERIRREPYQIEVQMAAQDPGSVKKRRRETAASAREAARVRYGKQVTRDLHLGEAAVRRLAPHLPGWTPASSADTVYVMFDNTWYQFMSVLSAVISRAGPDTRTVTTCMDGFKYALRLATRMDLSQERHALASTLARFTFASDSDELSPEPLSEEDLKRKLVAGEHLQQVWVEVVNAAGGGDEGTAAAVGEEIDELKRRFIVSTNFKALHQIQSRLQGDVNVVMQGRYFIREGHVGKLCAGGDQRRYRLFLFSDALLYASQAGGDKFKVHRVILLAFARVVPLPPTLHYGGVSNLFQVVSPQKTVTLFTDRQASRDAWVAAIRRMAAQQRQIRDETLRVAHAMAGESRGGMTQQVMTRLNRSAAFLHRTGEELQRRGWAGGARGREYARFEKGHCSLCLRSYSMFNRRSRCPSCDEDRCGRCVQQRVAGGAGGRQRVRVCDGCFSFTPEYVEVVKQVERERPDC